jgi:hypothetical protein
MFVKGKYSPCSSTADAQPVQEGGVERQREQVTGERSYTGPFGTAINRRNGATLLATSCSNKACRQMPQGDTGRSPVPRVRRWPWSPPRLPGLATSPHAGPFVPRRCRQGRMRSLGCCRSPRGHRACAARRRPGSWNTSIGAQSRVMGARSNSWSASREFIGRRMDQVVER